MIIINNFSIFLFQVNDYDLVCPHWQVYSMIYRLHILWSKIKICPLKLFKCKEMDFLLLILLNILLAIPPARHWSMNCYDKQPLFNELMKQALQQPSYLRMFPCFIFKILIQGEFSFSHFAVWKLRFRKGIWLTIIYKWESSCQAPGISVLTTVFFFFFM